MLVSVAVLSDGTLGVFDSKVLSVEGALVALGSLGADSLGVSGVVDAGWVAGVVVDVAAASPADCTSQPLSPPLNNSKPTTATTATKT